MGNETSKIKAICVLENNKMDGVIHLEEIENNKVKIKGEIKGLKKGLHGFHIHNSGNLTKGCDSCCSHYNPYNKNHGGQKDEERHVGDLGNIFANEKGIAKINITDHLVKLRGKYSVIGRSIIIHEDPDDLGNGGNAESLKTGNAGKRLACGIIGFA